MSTLTYYHGNGKRPETPVTLPVINRAAQISPEGYLATTALATAVDTAITLGMPLLLTGEPGSGKSTLAESVAWELLGENEKPLRFVTKSDTRSTDLFYHFDTVGRFHASNTPDADSSPERFIHFRALGRAILQSKPFALISNIIGEKRAGNVHSGKPKKTVVLIDEIDKAPRDVPNDILVEIENMRFQIPELEIDEIRLQKEDMKFQPIVIITSNSEKALPEAFLRRCVYHFVDFPPFNDDKARNTDSHTVEDIVASRLGMSFHEQKNLLQGAISFFRFLRSNEARGIRRKPSLAELLNWLSFLASNHVPENSKFESLDPEVKKSSIRNLLLKNSEDHAHVNDWLNKWKAQANM